MSSQPTRRSFLKQVTAAAAVPLILPRLSFAQPANSRLQHACIGVMGMGQSDRGEIFSSGKVDIIALCDVDATRLAKAAEAFPDARLYRDWRELLEEEGDRIDSVNIATPDHMHAPIAMSAIRRGKHVYCQKPLTHEVYEARQLTLAARDKGVATQMGIQIHSHDFYRTAVIWLKDGAIGKVREWHSWCSASYSNDSKQRPEGADAIPTELDWEKWIGVAPERPYKNEVYHPFEWRRWRDFGSGATGDFGCHIFDPVFTALGIGAPNSVRAEVESESEEVWPAWAELAYEFPGTPLTAGPTINATWKDGGKQPNPREFADLPADYELPKSGSMLVGEEGTMILPHIGHPELYPATKFENYPKPTLDPLNHYHEFVNAAMGNGKADANFDFAGPLTEAVLLGNVAGRFPGETLKWNAGRMKFRGNRDANAYIKRKYRKGWWVKGL